MPRLRLRFTAAVLLWAAASVLAGADLYVITQGPDFSGPPERLLKFFCHWPESGLSSCSSVYIPGGEALDYAAEAPLLKDAKVLHLDLGEEFGTDADDVFRLKQFCVSLKAASPGIRLLVSGNADFLRKAGAEWYADFVEGAEVAGKSLRLSAGDLSVWAAYAGSPGVLIVRGAKPDQVALYWKYLEKGVSADAFLKPEPATVLPFIRDSDLASLLLIPPGEAMTVRVPSQWYSGAEGMDGSSLKLHADGNGLSFYWAGAESWEIVTLTRPPSGEGFFAESKSVTGKRTWVLDEILAHVQQDAMRARIVLPAYSASTETLLRMKAGGMGRATQIRIAGSTLFSEGQETYWGWESVEIEGKLWKGKELPPIPLLQPQQVRIKPFELRPLSEYQYTLHGEQTVDAVPCVRVDFAPTPSFMARKLPGWKGSLWVRQDDLSMFRVSRSQVNLTGEVLENEEDLRYARAEGVLVPVRVLNRENLSILGSWTLVEVDMAYANIRKVDGLAGGLEKMKESAKRVMAYRDKGWEPLMPEQEKTLYLALGMARDPGYDYPMPLGGLAWFSLKPEKQYSFIFAGVLGMGSRTFFLGKTSLTLDGFYFAVPGDDAPYQHGKEVEAETVQILPADVGARLLFPLTSTFSLSAGLQESYRHYKRSDKTDPLFSIPASGFTSTTSLALNWTRGGWTAIASGEGFTRHSFREWGYPDDPHGSKDGLRYGLTLGKDVYWSGLNRTHVDASALGGRDLDRFSSHSSEGTQSLVRGFPSGALIGEELAVLHIAHTLIIPRTLNLTFGVDAARYRSPDARTLVGIGVSSFFTGPWETLGQVEAGFGLKGEGKGWTLRLFIFKSLK